MIVLDREAGWQGGPCVLALGMFDGVHMGHRALLKAAVGDAQAAGVPCIACGFAGHPLSTLSPGNAPAELTPREEKIALMGALGLGALLLRPFTPEFARLTPEEYVKLLVDAFSPREIVVGYNHRFGAGGTGTPERLTRLGERYGFAVRVVERVCVDGEPVSASAIRAALAAGEVKRAARMLGRWYAISGRVVTGKRIARSLGFPTANIEQQPLRALPRNGVYVAEAKIEAAPDGLLGIPAAVIEAATHDKASTQDAACGARAGIARQSSSTLAVATAARPTPDAEPCPTECFESWDKLAARTAPDVKPWAEHESPPAPHATIRAVLNIGLHPTLPAGPPTIEAHLLDYDGDLYGARLTLKLIGFLRGEQRFPDVDALRAQVTRDIHSARQFTQTQL